MHIGVLFFFLCSRVHHEGIFVRQSRLRVRSRGCEALVGFLSRPSTQSFSHLFSRCFFSILVCEAFSNCHLFFVFIWVSFYDFCVAVYILNDVNGNLTKYSARIQLFFFQLICVNCHIFHRLV